MKVISAIEHRTRAEGYGPFFHIAVTFQNEHGERLFASVNPTLWQRHGLTAIGMPGWYRGEPIQ